MAPTAAPGAPGTRYRHLAELALGFLDSAGEPRSGGEITAQVMGAAFGRQPAFVRSVEELLAQDERFTRDDAGLWRLAAWEPGSALGSLLAEQTFAVIDVETTGGRGERRRVIELAAVLVRGGRVCGQFESLVQPAQPTTRFVAGRSGITPEALETAPPAPEALAAFSDFVSDAVLAGHNVAADLSALNYEAIWSGLPPFGNAALDTEELAARLLPTLKRPSLARVATALNLAQPVRHRALADARLTASLLLRLLAQLDKHGIDSFEALQRWLSTRLAARQERVRRVRSVPAAGMLRDLPEAPGVYCFLDAAGEPLYVGKAASLRARVGQHFSGASLAARHHETLLDRTASVTHEVVACELDALLLESARIRALCPPYNVLERSRRGCPFLRLEAGAFPRVAQATEVTDGADEYFGPYRTTQDVRWAIGTLERVFELRSCRRALPATRKAMRRPCERLAQRLCPAPCAGLVAPQEYAVLVELARTYLHAGREAALQSVETLLEDSAKSATLRAVLSDVRGRLRRLRRDLFPVSGGHAGGTVAMAYPAQGGGLRLFLVHEGRLIGRDTVHEAADARRLASRLLDGLQVTEEDALDADQENILLRWLHHHLGEPDVAALPMDDVSDALVAFVADRLAWAEQIEEPDVEAEIMDAGEAFGGGVFDFEEVP